MALKEGKEKDGKDDGEVVCDSQMEMHLDWGGVLDIESWTVLGS